MKVSVEIPEGKYCTGCKLGNEGQPDIEVPDCPSLKPVDRIMKLEVIVEHAFGFRV
ncbi:hypothetical protein LCGC14_1553340 [marine sediment metagenome]|uniref:Uncharacterized protein n=1 Tax=marine sediment metagenome TaxID=412755 RepID=A0A0F9IPP1_9ZZZZ